MKSVVDSKKPRAAYVENAQPGTIIAFRDLGTGKMLSAKITEVNEESFTVSTKRGDLYNVLKENVVWVKTGLRWPKGIYQELKGMMPNED